MIKSKIIILLLTGVFAFCITTKAQTQITDSTKNKKFKFSAISLYFNSNIYGNRLNTSNISESLIENSSLPVNNLENFEESFYNYYNQTLSYGFSTNFRKKKTELRFSLGYFFTQMSDGNYHLSTVIATDTFTSNTSSETFSTETSQSEYYNVDLKIKGIELSTAYLYHPGIKNKRFKGYFGIGIDALFGYNNSYILSYSNSTSTRLIDHNSLNQEYLDRSFDYVYEQERVKAPSPAPTMFRIYTPIGLSFQLSKKENFLKYTHLGLESKIGIAHLSNEVLSSISSGLNLSYTFKR